MGKEQIFSVARRIFATSGYDGLRMRTLASQVGMQLSVLYHYYPSKDALLEAIFHETNRELGQKRRALPEQPNAADALRQLIAFQFQHAEQVVAVLKYYLHFRATFPKRERGYLPEKSTLHVQEVLERGMASGEFQLDDLEATAGIITHAINGYLLEFFPAEVDAAELDQLVREISDFILRALAPRGT
jgi:AcrR family transcriptional regulator